MIATDKLEWIEAINNELESMIRIKYGDWSTEKQHLATENDRT